MNNALELKLITIDDMITHLKETGFDLNYVDDYPTNKPDNKELVENVHTPN
jgi:hypothetical protein